MTWYVVLMKEIAIQPDEQLACLIVGEDDDVNRRLLKAMFRLPGRRLVIGDAKDLLDPYLAVGAAIEVYPSGTLLPRGSNVLIYDGREPLGPSSMRPNVDSRH